ncbi:hypothetical protein RJT34_32402 [Clitoria ternatea]|uniref:Uncharacterized protein n=1 Tax=Clitoria ternatea TaxID=43366 RepID=A0AAN9I9F4_CLITE
MEELVLFSLCFCFFHFYPSHRHWISSLSDDEHTWEGEIFSSCKSRAGSVLQGIWNSGCMEGVCISKKENGKDKSK